MRKGSEGPGMVSVRVAPVALCWAFSLMLTTALGGRCHFPTKVDEATKVHLFV